MQDPYQQNDLFSWEHRTFKKTRGIMKKHKEEKHHKHKEEKMPRKHEKHEMPMKNHAKKKSK